MRSDRDERRPRRTPAPRRPLPTYPWLKRLLIAHQLVQKGARQLGRPTAWLTSGAPVEILLAMGALPQYPENYAALCGARRVAVELCQRAEAAGYSADLCGYARADLGSVLAPERAPFGGLSRPDVLIACNNICGTVTKWWEHLAARLEVPLFILDTPFCAEAERPTHLLVYAERQLEELVRFLAAHTRRRFSERAFREVARRSKATVGLWNEILECCTARPSPLSAQDRFLAMAPVVTLRGTRSALAYYRLLLSAVQSRVRRGIGAVRNERKRLLWDNIAIWYALGDIFGHLAAHGASVPVDTYTSAWTGTIGAEHPLRDVARVYSEVYLNQGMHTKLVVMERMIRRFGCDGFILHSNRSCKPYSLGQQVILQELSRRTDRPGLLLDADMVDSRHYDRDRVQEQLTRFLEVIS